MSPLDRCRTEDMEKHARIHQVIDFLCSCVESLLTQLHEMETAFDGFWEKHQLKMEQYLQLWKFEQNFQEVREETRSDFGLSEMFQRSRR